MSALSYAECVNGLVVRGNRTQHAADISRHSNSETLRHIQRKARNSSSDKTPTQSIKNLVLLKCCIIHSKTDVNYKLGPQLMFRLNEP